MLKKLLILCIIISLPSLVFIENILGDGDAARAERQALYIKAPEAGDYVRIETEVEDINILSENEYTIELSIKVLGYNLDEPGVIFRLEFLDPDENVKFSIRLTNDNGVLFYYPSSKLIAYKQENAWSPGSWNKFEFVLSGNNSFFYINGSLVGENEPNFPALSSGYRLTSIRFGEIDSQRSAFEGFIDYFGIRIDNEPIFREDFNKGLSNYRILNSENSIAKIMNAEAYTTLSLEVSARNVVAGDYLELTCVLKDSYGKGVPNRAIHLRYPYEGETAVIEIGNTSSDGYLKYLWRAPYELSGHIELNCIFMGDDLYSDSISDPISLYIKHKPNIFKDNRFIAFVLGASLALLFISSSRRFGLERSSTYLFIVSVANGTFFSAVKLVNLLNIEYHLAYSPRTIMIELISQKIDVYVWAISFILSFAAIIISKDFRAKLPNTFALAYLALLASFIIFSYESKFFGTLIAFLASTYLVLISIFNAKSFLSASRAQTILGFIIVPSTIILLIEIFSIGGWAFNAFDPHFPFDGSSRWLFSIIELNFSNILYPLSPFLLIAVLFSWVWFPLIKRGGRKFLSSLPSCSEGDAGSSRTLKLLKWPILLTSVTCALFVSYYPYLYYPKLAGVDAPWYHAQLTSMTDWESALKILTGSGAPRGAYLLLLYLVKLLTGIPVDTIIKIGPALPASFLALSTYLFVSIGIRDRRIALLSSFLAAFSINTTVGIFAATFANWLALSWVILLFAIILHSPNKGLKFSLPLALLLNFLVLVTHPWTWVFLIVILITYEGITLIRQFLKRGEEKFGKDSQVIFMILFINVALVLSFFALVPNSEFIRMMYYGVWRSISIENLLSLLPTLNFTIEFYVGGFFGNPLIYIFAVLGAFMLNDFKNEFNRMIISILLPASVLGFTVGQFWQWRILYMVPYHILAALGFVFIIHILKRVSNVTEGQSNDGKNLLRLSQAILILLLILSQFNYALRCMNYIIQT